MSVQLDPLLKNFLTFSEARRLWTKPLTLESLGDTTTLFTFKRGHKTTQFVHIHWYSVRKLIAIYREETRLTEKEAP